MKTVEIRSPDEGEVWAYEFTSNGFEYYVCMDDRLWQIIGLKRIFEQKYLKDVLNLRLDKAFPVSHYEPRRLQFLSDSISNLLTTLLSEQLEAMKNDLDTYSNIISGKIEIAKKPEGV